MVLPKIWIEKLNKNKIDQKEQLSKKNVSDKKKKMQNYYYYSF